MVNWTFINYHDNYNGFTETFIDEILLYLLMYLLLTCQVPILETLRPNGLWRTKQSLKASPRSSRRFPSNAAMAANGKAEENRQTYPNCDSISRCSENAPSYCEWKYFCINRLWKSSTDKLIIIIIIVIITCTLLLK